MDARWKLLVALAFVAGCGSRSELGLTGSEQTTTSPAPNGCKSAVLAGAPTPMKGYCSTRANVAPGRAPAGPKQTATVTLGAQGSTYLTEMVVDPEGRVFVAFDANVMSGVTPRTLAAIEPDGTIAWTKTFDDGVLSALFLNADGHLGLRLWQAAPYLLTLDHDGTEVAKHPLPGEQINDFAVGADGSLFGLLSNFEDRDRVAKVSPDGDTLWVSEPFVPGCGDCSSHVALTGQDDRVVVATAWSPDGTGQTWTTRLIELAPDGSVAWKRDMEGLFTQGPAVHTDGTLRLALGLLSAPPYTTILYALDAHGTILWQTDTHDDPEQTWADPLVIAPSGTTIIHAFGGIDAVDAAGQLVWHRQTQTNLDYDAFVDPDGTLVLQIDGKVTGLDAETGAERWTLAGTSYPGGMALGPQGSMAVISGNGLLLARDP